MTLRSVIRELFKVKRGVPDEEQGKPARSAYVDFYTDGPSVTVIESPGDASAENENAGLVAYVELGLSHPSQEQ